LSNKSNLSAFNQRNVGFMKSKFRQWWLTIPSISTKRATTFHLKQTIE
jgi:hypothetical protein